MAHSPLGADPASRPIELDASAEQSPIAFEVGQLNAVYDEVRGFEKTSDTVAGLRGGARDRTAPGRPHGAAGPCHGRAEDPVNDRCHSLHLYTVGKFGRRRGALLEWGLGGPAGRRAG